MDLKLTQVQKQILSQKMELSVKILQMSSQELCDFIENTKLENPIIELDPYKSEGEDIKDFYSDNTYSAKKSSYKNDDDDAFEQLNGECDCETLFDCLVRQINFLNITPYNKNILLCVAEHVDKYGYLIADDETIAKNSGYSTAEIKNAVSIVQSFEPMGVGAHNLKECLLLQLGDNEIIEKNIVSEFLEQIGKNKLSYIGDKLNISPFKVASAVERIKSLDPKPGLIYCAPVKAVYIVPDIIVKRLNKEIVVFIANEFQKDIRISQSYINMLNKTTDKATAEYIENKINQASWLQNCIVSRNKTLLDVAKCIVTNQNEFFEKGTGDVKVLRMSDVANQLNIHESTVSRAVNGKYLQCCYGIFPLKYFFPSGVKVQDSEESVSALVIKEKIKSYILKEDKNAPLSDQAICNMLKADGIACSRRTVAKYREQLGIANSSLR